MKQNNSLSYNIIVNGGTSWCTPSSHCLPFLTG